MLTGRRSDVLGHPGRHRLRINQVSVSVSRVTAYRTSRNVDECLVDSSVVAFSEDVW